tara:strand:- start:383 stop:1276 length:894 start_codon:yes stop_codon:yes gene_type:complete
MMQGFVNNFNSISPVILPIFAFGFGACIGSFLNVCIYRIPKGVSIVHPRSRCGSCGKPIPFYLNVPIVAWIILRGKAHCCGAPFSMRYPAIELLTGALFCTSWVLLPPSIALIGFVWISILVAVTFIDLDHMLIPDRFSIGALGVGILLSLLVPNLHSVFSESAILASIQSMFTAIIGALIGSAVILWIMILAEVVLRKEALGFGDVKLMGAIGAFCGWQGAVFALFGGAVLGTIAIGLIQVVRLIRPKKDSNAEEERLVGREVPFGPMLAAGSLLYFLYLGPTVDWCFSEFAWILQ